MILEMAVIHISEAEAEREFSTVIARVRAGEEVVIGYDTVLRSIPEQPLRRLSESLRLAQEHRSSATLDQGFASDLDAIVLENSEPLSLPECD
jgi:hypothetical protein